MKIMNTSDLVLAAICFDANGLVPAIAQQHDTGEVLMMAWMNAEAVRGNPGHRPRLLFQPQPRPAVAQRARPPARPST